MMMMTTTMTMAYNCIFSGKMQTARLHPKSEQQKLDLYWTCIQQCYLQISLTIWETNPSTALLSVSLNKWSLTGLLDKVVSSSSFILLVIPIANISIPLAFISSARFFIYSGPIPLNPSVTTTVTCFASATNGAKGNWDANRVKPYAYKGFRLLRSNFFALLRCRVGLKKLLSWSPLKSLISLDLVSTKLYYCLGLGSLLTFVCMLFFFNQSCVTFRRPWKKMAPISHRIRNKTKTN